MMEALNMFIQHNPQLGTVARIYSKAVIWEDMNYMVALRCAEALVSGEVERLGLCRLQNTEPQMEHQIRDLFYDIDDDDGNSNAMCSGQGKGANTEKGKNLVQRDLHSEEDDNLAVANDTRALP